MFISGNLKLISKKNVITLVWNFYFLPLIFRLILTEHDQFLRVKRKQLDHEKFKLYTSILTSETWTNFIDNIIHRLYDMKTELKFESKYDT